jgi:hypothetical protein
LAAHIEHVGAVDKVLIDFSAFEADGTGFVVGLAKVEVGFEGVVEKQAVTLVVVEADVKGYVFVEGIGVAVKAVLIGAPDGVTVVAQIRMAGLVTQAVKMLTVLDFAMEEELGGAIFVVFGDGGSQLIFEEGEAIGGFYGYRFVTI